MPCARLSNANALHWKRLMHAKFAPRVFAAGIAPA